MRFERQNSRQNRSIPPWDEDASDKASAHTWYDGYGDATISTRNKLLTPIGSPVDTNGLFFAGRLEVPLVAHSQLTLSRTRWRTLDSL